jgi:hypothetical protein
MGFDFRRVRLLVAGVLALGTLSACDDDDPTDPGAIPPTNLAVTATGATTARVTFTGRSGDTRYIVQRAEGTTGGTFAEVETVDAPAVAGQVTFDDSGLLPSTAYRYQVATVRGTQTSGYATAVTVTTLAAGSQGTIEINQDISASRTLYADTVYLLKGFIHVLSGATLTIQAGTTIKGASDPVGSSLFILPGARIVAVGTAGNPIVFTSDKAAGERSPGDWGGLVIVGNATVNRGQTAVEGTGGGTGSGTNYTVNYGGATATNDADNSGELRYVRVEYAGYAISLNNELNAFTFATVGSGTKLSYLQSLNGLDDSFEWFGGTVDADHLVSYNSGDDHFDMSEGYRGRVQFIIAHQDTVLPARAGSGGASGDPSGIENDNCNNTNCTNTATPHASTPLTVPLVANFTLIGDDNAATQGSGGGIGMMLRRGVGGYYVNGVIARWSRAAISVRDAETYVRAGSAATPDLATADLAIRNVAVLQSGATFQTGGTSVQNTFDLAGNALTESAATTASLFTAFPTTVTATTTATAFDWTPPAGSAAATGGLATFTGKLATKATGASSTGHTFAGTAYMGAAAPGGDKWWDGWTRYGWK